ncbi:MAG: cytochrome c biogenesis protein CcsA [Verrucomicrobia bacterium]|nr:cytochrome c biogenesis protein CcsA [Verrucomicrobiota bacterium]MBI3870121.1 cytochrome c biogenesis protein CcsA [Verrucomicrobiota bacterium]
MFYGLSTVHSIFLLRGGFRQDNRVNYLLLLAGFACHTLAMMKRGFSLQRCPINNLFEATVFIGWTIVGAYLVIGAWSRVRFLGAFASPLLLGIGVFALMPGLDSPYLPQKPNFSGGLHSLHAALILLASGAFGLSAVAGIMYLTQERDLKQHKLRAVLSRLPPIHRLERITRLLVWSGLALLTGGLVSGAFWLRQRQGVFFKPDSTIIWAILVWVMYVVLIVLHTRFSHRGRRFALGAVGGFTFVILTFWGFYLLSGIHRTASIVGMNAG